MRATLANRFWVKTELRANGCLEWTAGVFRCGYGQIRDKGRNKYAHRVAWELTVGPVPDGLWVLHSCDNRRCVNPAHLYVGTAAVNSGDMVAKGRQCRGEGHHKNKLTADSVLAIRADTRPRTVIAEEHGVTAHMISLIRNRRAWTWLAEKP
jgi:hypothetical protein